MGFGDWLDRRLGFRQIIHRAVFEPVRGGPAWAYVFGLCLVVLFAVQGLTGMALAAYYSPSPQDAWASVNFIQRQVWLGWLLRGMHHHCASAMVLVLLAHLLQTLWFGAYKPPRELNWLAGVLLMFIVLAFAFTGCLLPWDQKGYWATQVATSIVGTVPWLGPGISELLVGGKTYGHLTLTHFYALHVLVLPLSLMFVLLVHIYLFRRHGVTVRPGISKQEAERRTRPFFPSQLFRDVFFSLLCVGACAFFALRGHGTSLEAPADPSSPFLARPEWYFLPLFQLLKYFEGGWELVGTVLLPGLAAAFLVAFPFLYIGLRPSTPWAHSVLAGMTTGGILGAALLGWWARQEDQANPSMRKMAAEARQAALGMGDLAERGIPPEGPLTLRDADPVFKGEKVFRQNCEGCHHDCGEEPYRGDPCLDGYLSRPWLSKLLRNPQSPYFFGNSHMDEMDAYGGSEEKLKALTEFLYSLRGAGEDLELAKTGRSLFASEGCMACHGLDGTGTGEAPDLLGYGSPQWLTAFIRHPNAPRFYGDKNNMKAFKLDVLKAEDLEAVVAYLQSKGFKSPLSIP